MNWVEALAKPEISGAGFAFYVTATIIVTLALYYWLYERQLKASALNHIPGPKPVPIFGNALDFTGNPAEFFNTIQNKFTIYPCGLTRFYVGPYPYCLVYKESGFEKILSSHKLIDKTDDYQALEQWLGTGLLTSTGAKWQYRRKLITPAFHFKILEDFIEIFNQQSSIFTGKLKEKVNGSSFDIFPYVTLCTLDIIMDSAMGRSINAQNNSESDYVKAIYEITRIIMTRQTRPWLRPEFLFHLFGYRKMQEKCLQVLHGLADETIRERRKEFQLRKKQNKCKEEEVLGKRKRLAFLDLLLEHTDGEGGLSDEDIREEVNTFIFEGHDTTAAGISWCIYLLGIYPEAQKKVQDELDVLFGDSDRPATSADLREMKYLECCIKEALRLFPSVPFIGRLLKEDIVIDGYTIPSDTRVLLLQYVLHRDARNFPDPEEFHPSRFFPENSIKRHPYAYVPFSAGPRNCIGQKFALNEEKVILSAFLRKYRVESVEKREDLVLTGDIILRSLNGINVKIFSRK